MSFVAIDDQTGVVGFTDGIDLLGFGIAASMHSRSLAVRSRLAKSDDDLAHDGGYPGYPEIRTPAASA
jgi:hypothetical protein